MSNLQGTSKLREALGERVLLLDGAMGTQIQAREAQEEDFRGERFKDARVPLKGNNDLLVLTRPDLIAGIHETYLDAGADIITTCTFNAQRISQAEYGTGDAVADINYEGARLARNCADRFTTKTPARPRFVAGSVGPTTALLTMADATVAFDAMTEAFTEQMRALIRGGVDALLIETALDPLNAKAALCAAEAAMQAEGRRVELMVSATVTDGRGHLLCGQSIEAFAVALGHAPLLSIGLNCSMGPESMLEPMRRLSAVAPVCTSMHPNAGLPDSLGQYAETPEMMADVMQKALDERIVNIIGGCCGTTPAHIAAMREVIDRHKGARVPSKPSTALQLSGLETLTADGFFVNVGERCNVAGSRKFLRLINEGKYDEALAIAARQVDDGAIVVDVNMDDGLLGTRECMTRFLKMLAADPAVARVPVMIDSSDFDVIVAALKCLPGKGIVNSISLKEGEGEFLRKARIIKSLGAAVVVMAFDEEGQATTYQRRVDVCRRAYKLLTDKAGYSGADIIFDPNVLTVATGMEEHLTYARDYVEAVRTLRSEMPLASCSGGVSNLSFAFRGNNPMREAMHAVFLYRARQAGLNMAILNPATSVAYDDVPTELREAIERALFTECTAEAVESLIASVSAPPTAPPAPPLKGGDSKLLMPVEERLKIAMMKGDATHLQEDIEESLASGMTAVEIISGPLMAGMNAVGDAFGEGRMFLPQVVKTARAMKAAVAILEPRLAPPIPPPRGGATNLVSPPLGGGSGGAAGSGGACLLATVKGDVHDIGKNIVGAVMACNGYRVVDLGVMVPPEAIVEAIRREKPDMMGLSGLISPSLQAMVDTVRLMAGEGIDIPVMIGGAATSALHTALKIAPEYRGPVIYVSDASQNPLVAARLRSEQCAEYVQSVRDEQEQLRRNYYARTATPRVAKQIDWSGYTPRPLPANLADDVLQVPVSELIPLIDWLYFYHAWRVKEHTDEGRDLRADVDRLLAELAAEPEAGCVCALRFFDATGREDGIVAGGVEIPTPIRPLGADRKASMGTFVCPTPGVDKIGVFATTINCWLNDRFEQLRREQGADSYDAMLMQTLMDRLAEAASEWLSRRTAWDVVRPAVGYPSLSDQQAIFQLDKILDFSRLGITLTESGAMLPRAATAGIYISHPQARYL